MGGEKLAGWGSLMREDGWMDPRVGTRWGRSRGAEGEEPTGSSELFPGHSSRALLDAPDDWHSLSSSTSRQQFRPHHSLKQLERRPSFRPSFALSMEQIANHVVSLFICFRVASLVVWIGRGWHCCRQCWCHWDSVV